MRIRLALFPALLLALAALMLPAADSTPRVTFLVRLGELATRPDRWDGSAKIENGHLANVEPWHFSARDSVTPSGSWTAVVLTDAVAPYADAHYTEMRGGETPAVLYHAIGVYLTIEAQPGSRISIETAQGNFSFSLSEIGEQPSAFLGARATVARVPTPEKLTTPEFEDDEPSAAALPNGDVAVGWVAYRDRADRILLRTRSNGVWSQPEEITPKPADIFRCALVATSRSDLRIFWSQRDSDVWNIWTRARKAGQWQTAERLTQTGTSNFLRAAVGPDGSVYVVYQSFRNGQSDIYLRAFSANWKPELRVSESAANDWEPAIASAPDGSVYIAWDTYDKGNYDISYRVFRNAALQPVEHITTNQRFHAHVAVTVDSQNRPWLAWDESGVNWAKDQGFLIPTPLATPIHQQRSIRVAVNDGGRWMELQHQPSEAFPEAFRQNAEHPQIIFDVRRELTMLFRHWTRRNSRTIGSPIVWENYLTRFDGAQWSEPIPFESSTGSIEKNPSLSKVAGGPIWAAWMTDGRPFSTAVPANADVYCARIDDSSRPATINGTSFKPFAEPAIEAIPSHNHETGDVRAIRQYKISSAGREYRIYRGDMHRHTDVSQDFKYDGSLLEAYRYAIDSAAFDYLAVTDHQAGYDQEFTWWQTQKLVDLFSVAGAFTPLYSYERSVLYPNGHRNVIFAERGVRTLPIPEDEATGKTGAAALYAYLKKNHGISMPHSTGTDQGTDWRDNDPEVEPLVEIYQGYRNSYEYEGAPRAATELNKAAQKSGWEPAGFWWNALAKGYKLGVQASSDHWSTHISYACLVAENFTRAGLLDAIRKRHAYGATDNIVLDFRANGGGQEHIMGDAFTASSAPKFVIRVVGTGAIKQVDLIKNRTFIYMTRPGTRQVSLEFTDRDFGPGESWYYARVLQEDGQLAWSSPVWITR